MYAGLIIALVLILFLIIAFCTFFTARLAQLKMRSKFWGIAGLLFGVLGLVFVSYLPSKRDDEVDTNPVKYFFAKLPPLSKKTSITIGVMGAVVIVALVLYENIPVLIKNHKYETEISKQNLNTSQPKEIDGEVEMVYTGAESSYAIGKDGTVYSFGHQFVKKIEQKAKKVLSNDSAVFVLDTDGVLYQSTDNELVEISDSVVDFSVSEDTVAFIKTNNKLYMYGNNAHYQIETSDNLTFDQPVHVLSNIKQVVCETTFTVALNKSGEVYAFGENIFAGEPIITEPEKIATNVKQIAAGDRFIMVLTNDNTVNIIRKGGEEFTKLAEGVTSITAAKSSALYITEAGELYGLFNNRVGQLGTKGTFLNEPKLVKNQVEWASTSGLHTVIKTTDGDILASGYNNCGQLGLSGSTSKFSKFVALG